MKRLLIFVIFPSLGFLLFFMRLPLDAVASPGEANLSKSWAKNYPEAPHATASLTITPVPGNNRQSRPAGASTPIPAQDAEEIPDLDVFFAYLPFIEHQLPRPTPTPTHTPTQTPAIQPGNYLFCDTRTRPLPIPDNDPLGVENSFYISEPGTIVDLDIYLNIDHSWLGDLSVWITHQETGQSVLILDRPGIPANDNGCSGDDLIAILDDGASSSVEGKCSDQIPAISGTYKPAEALSAFAGDLATGNWTLRVADEYPGDTGRLQDWCMEVEIAAALPPPNPTPTPTQLPASASVSGVTGRDQALPLDCESRSAVDWARFFGFTINEFDFFYNLPSSDNPDKGFVGNVNGTWGQIPPNDYGVHAPPVAALLRDYGVKAYAHRYLRWRDVQAEIAAGRPVIVWEIGQVWQGIPVYYRPSDGNLTVVARYEHTVMVVGYTQSTVTIQDGYKRYTRSLEDFLDSWSALRNMAILAHP